MAAHVEGRRVSAGPVDPRLRSEFTYSIVELNLRKNAPLDKRASARLRTRLRAGRLADRRDRVLVDCLIQDRSRGGARLRLAGEAPLPHSFLLYDDISGARFTAQLAWQRGRDAGVRLVAV